MQAGPSKWGGGGINVSGEAPFEIRGFSLANAAALVGTAITGASFYEYFSSGGSGGLSGIGFVYGIPVMLVGLALKVGWIVRGGVFGEGCPCGMPPRVDRSSGLVPSR